jgi:hypothetical protein
MRTDWEDVPVPQLGGTELRVYALTGTARAELIGDIQVLAKKGDATDPETIRGILDFQGRVVAASLGYARDEWSGLAEVMGSGAIEALYDVAARLSGLEQEHQERAKARLKVRRSAASGTV